MSVPSRLARACLWGLGSLVAACGSGDRPALPDATSDGKPPPRVVHRFTTDAEGQAALHWGAEPIDVLVVDATTNRPVGNALVEVLPETERVVLRVSREGEPYDPELVFAEPGQPRTIPLRLLTPALASHAAETVLTAYDTEYVGELDLDGIAAVSAAEDRPLVVFLPPLAEGAAAVQQRRFVYRSPLPGVLFAIGTASGRRPGNSTRLSAKGRVVSVAGIARAGVQPAARHLAAAAQVRPGDQAIAPRVSTLQVAADVTGRAVLNFTPDDRQGRLLGLDVGLNTLTPSRRLLPNARSFAIATTGARHIACVRPVFEGAEEEPIIRCAPLRVAMAQPAPDLRMSVRMVSQTVRRAGLPFPVEIEIHNAGEGDARGIPVAVVVSRDGTAASGTGEVRHVIVDGVRAGGRAVRRTDIRTDVDGALYVLAAVDPARTAPDGNLDGTRAVAPFVSMPQGLNRSPVVSLAGGAGVARSTRFQGEPLTVMALADDAEEGDLSDTIEWHSSRDGVIGRGRSVTAGGLSPGIHRLKAQVRDTGATLALVEGQGRERRMELQPGAEPPAGASAELVLEVVASTEPPPNAPPAAWAGPDLTATVGLPFAPLTTTFDEDGDALTFSWTLEAPVGSMLVLRNPQDAAPLLVPDVPGRYHLRMSVSDGKVVSTDDVDVIALPASANGPPVATLSLPPAATVGVRVAATATASDPQGDGLTLSYVLQGPAGSDALIEGADTLMPSFVPDVPGRYHLTFHADDGRGGHTQVFAETGTPGFEPDAGVPDVGVDAPVDAPSTPDAGAETRDAAAPDTAAPEAAGPDAVGPEAAQPDALGDQVAPGLPNGAACTTGPQCASTYCVDGVCCDRACTGLCASCLASRTGQADGLCQPVVAGTDPDGECVAEPASTCGRDGECDGITAACRMHGNTTVCVASSCVGGIYTPARTCDTRGMCGPQTPVSCAPYVCGTIACRTTCSTDTECTSGYFCAAGPCLPLRSDGAACARPGECLSGNCVDGVCCDAPCNGTCQACNLPTLPGVCGSVLGADDLDTCTGSSTCDGIGGCRTKKGQACADDQECSTDHCADGVCCDGPCNATCEGCLAVKTGSPDGQCGPVGVGQDPDGECPDDGPMTCGLNGFCNGSGACQIYPLDTVCAPGTCNAGIEISPSTCDGAGRCMPGGQTMCTPYACAGSQCGTNCGTDAECFGGHRCHQPTSSCRKDIGAPCTNYAECLSDFCVDGVCCSTQCSGVCVQCNGVAGPGNCSLVPSGVPDPDTCPSPDYCDGDGSCVPITPMGLGPVGPEPSWRPA